MKTLPDEIPQNFKFPFICIIFCPNQYIVCYIINIILRVEEQAVQCLSSVFLFV